MTGIPWIDPAAPPEVFPPVGRALREPNGLLAAGADLSPERLVAAYRRGIFPWYSESEPILWWSPDPRAVIPPGGAHASRSLARRLRREELHRLSADHCFGEVIAACAARRPGQPGTWLTREMRTAYRSLHDLGLAH